MDTAARCTTAGQHAGRAAGKDHPTRPTHHQPLGRVRGSARVGGVSRRRVRRHRGYTDAVRSDDYFIKMPVTPTDPWGPRSELILKLDLIEALRVGSIQGVDDLDAAIGLAMLVHEELESFGTSGGERVTDAQMSVSLRSLHAVLKRLDVAFSLPFRDLSTFHSYWVRVGAKGSYQARRDLLEALFEPLHAGLHRLEERAFEAVLAEPVSPHGATGWPKVDREVEELRKRFRQGTTPQDYRAVGTHAVGVIEALSRTVYNPVKHLREGEVEPPVDKSKQRLERVVDEAAPGHANAEVRGLARKAIELAQSVKHSETPTRRDAGIAADACVLLANILRRLADD